ncbi:hypothetical protein [Azospirillum picis]|uniref:Ribosomal protein S12 methylthiotransferase accessory factor YcaO n=1 Tax=Azospirillum picis TaxID=488438 RepID=A0ABU0MMW5_9PROT|nr:hypothetical protein [Azospirillum picis]MBP2301231.1 ribosomal protein S12 methylthiotransferase accessory factor YcaO [Azospirillum picis]MDQ0534806.1 ribosomal protein S12 methylthiotransferase accessory factor YcaO [Azospirillum picis]
MLPRELLAEAKEIVARQGAGEAAYRAATHAAYYALYHLMCDYFSLDPSKRDEASHADIMRRLDQLDIPSAKPHATKARAKYRSLWRLRRQADYFFNDPYDDTQAELAIGYADDVFNLYP